MCLKATETLSNGFLPSDMEDRDTFDSIQTLQNESDPLVAVLALDHTLLALDTSFDIDSNEPCTAAGPDKYFDHPINLFQANNEDVKHIVYDDVGQPDVEANGSIHGQPAAPTRVKRIVYISRVGRGLLGQFPFLQMNIRRAKTRRLLLHRD